MPAPIVLWTLKKSSRKLTCEMHEHSQGTEIVLVEVRDSRRHEVCRAPGHWMTRMETWKRSALAKGWAVSYSDHNGRRDAGRFGRMGGHLRRLVVESCESGA